MARNENNGEKIICILWTMYGVAINEKLQWWPKVFGHLEFSPLNPIVNKSCKIKFRGSKMHQIIQNMKLSRGLELKLSLR